MVIGKYFSHDELKCPHCGKNGMQQEFIDKLDELRERIGMPMVLSSAYRCPEYNAQISSTGMTGPHTTGRAVDVLIYGKNAHMLVKTAMGMGFTGIGISQKGPHESRFIHLDDLVLKTRPWVWSY